MFSGSPRAKTARHRYPCDALRALALRLDRPQLRYKAKRALAYQTAARTNGLVATAYRINLSQRKERGVGLVSPSAANADQ